MKQGTVKHILAIIGKLCHTFGELAGHVFKKGTSEHGVRAAIKYNEPLKHGDLKNDSLVWIYIANESSPFSTYMNMISGIKGLHYRLNNKQWNYITDKFGIDGIPSYVLVDKSGHYSLRNDLRSGNQLRQTLQKALVE